ncbi:MAG: pyridoxal phosphate-dependent aminotransferase [Candidatus Tectomicrobia bacterium]|nr:pyridoxal phosphate-dependent aminotransferase [Candidatus Tectomicrobia bacterium]
MRFADRMERLKTESAFVVLAKAKELERRGRDIIHLEIGDADFDTPSLIVEEAYAQMKAGQTHYCPSAGMLELREACCEFLRREGRGDYKPAEIVVGPGGKPFLYYVIMAFAGEGDEVIYPDPGFPVYESVALYAGAGAVPLPILEEKGFRFTAGDLRSRVTGRTRLLILNYPHNPTGGTLTRRDLEEIAEIAIERDLIVLSDEVYAHMLFEGEHVSIGTLPGMRERTILLESFSKTYAMTGWRLGFVACPEGIAQKLTQLVTNSVSCVAPFMQLAGAKALLADQAGSRAMMEDYRRRRDLFIAGLNEAGGLSCKSPAGAFYAFPNVSGVPLSAEKFADYLLEEVGVATLPGSAFGAHAGKHIRMCFANSVANLERAVDRIADAVARLRK